MRNVFRVCLLLTVSWSMARLRAEEEVVLCPFEQEEDLGQWEVRSGKGTIGELPGQPRRKAFRLEFDPSGEYQPGYLYWRRVHRDWSGYDALVVDVTNPATAPVPGYVLVADQAWQDAGRTYWNRHNGGATFPPGITEWRIPVEGLYRGEAGSRNNDIKRNIDPDSIVRVDFGFGRKGAAGTIWLSNLRLVKAGRPESVLAFDFGPPAQSVMPGWTPVSHETRFDSGQGYGWGPQGGNPWNGAARDTTFGTALTQDFCESRNYTFRVAVPPGEYRVLFILENCGYWGGEQAKHRWRSLTVNGTEVWRDERADGPAHALLRFEDIEPVGKDLWETYMLPEITQPVELTVTAADPELALRFDADRPWACKLAALAICRSEDGDGSQWVAGQMDALAREFRQKAVCLDPPPAEFALPASWEPSGMVAWPVDIGDTITPDSIPQGDPASPEELELACSSVVRGEYEPLCLALRALRDMGQCRLALEGDLGNGVTVSTAVVHYGTSRDFNTIAYHIRPHTVRLADSVQLPAGLTREVVVTIHASKEAEPGLRRGTLLVRSPQDRVLLRVPLVVTVRDVVLDRETDYQMGFFGLVPPSDLSAEDRWALLEQTLVLLREHGMNAVSGGPNWQLKGWNNGVPDIDFGDSDRFYALLRRHGFDGPINGYGGSRFNGLHERYIKGAAAARVEKESGLPYAQAFARAWEAVHRHARTQQWPTIYYAMCDETRVRSVAEEELAFMKLMATVSARFPETVRTSGSYSVSFSKPPRDADDLLYWHQEFFKALDISSLNGHDQSVMDEARLLGKSIHIYNQGRTRYSFGLYQWSEFRKGVAARWQWHLNVLHGYQFFDLDGREPDTAMLCYGRERIHPTIDFERCREGAEDFYLYNTLRKLADSRRQDSRVKAWLARADALLQRLDTGVEVNQRTPPDWYDARQLKGEVVEICEGLLGQDR